MNELLLASAGEDVRLWYAAELNLHSVKQVETDSKVKFCTCSNDGQMIAYTYEGQGIAISTIFDESASNLKIPTACEQTNVAFSSNSRYIVSGGEDSVINIWDVNSRTAKRSLKDRLNPVSFCVFNYNGNVIASASVSGEIILTEVQSGLSCDPLIAPDTQTINCIAYSHFTRYILASVNNSGNLTLWDTKERKLSKTFSEHNAPATCLSFSPINEMLLCSAGLDKRIIFYDVCAKKSVKTMDASSPITCCDFLDDGTTVAVGSTSGHIFLYDLRHGSTPLKVVSAHRTSVKSVSFQKFRKRRYSRNLVEENKGIGTFSNDQNIKQPRGNIQGRKDLEKPLKEIPESDKQAPTGQPLKENLNAYEMKVKEKISTSLANTNNMKSPFGISSSSNEFFSPISVASSGIVRKPVRRENSNFKNELKPAMTIKEETPQYQLEFQEMYDNRKDFDNPEENISVFSKTSRSSQINDNLNPSAIKNEQSISPQLPNDDRYEHRSLRNSNSGGISPAVQKKPHDDFFSPLSINQSGSARKPVKRQKSNPKSTTKSTISAAEEGTRPDYRRSKSGLSRFLLRNKSTEDLRGMRGSRENSSTDLRSPKKKKSVDEMRKKDHAEAEREISDTKKGGLSAFKSPFKKKVHDKRSDESETSSLDSVSVEDKSIYDQSKTKQSLNESSRTSKFSGKTADRLSQLVPQIDPNQLMNDIQRSLLEPTELQRSASINSGDTVSTDHSVSQVTTNSATLQSAQFPLDFVQRMIDDAMEEFRISVQGEIVNLHSEFIRQMEIQKVEIGEIMRDHYANNDLLTEIQRLRAEIALLRFKN